jgi:hypothetical protein
VDDSALSWRKSTFSPENGNGCVEFAQLPDGGVAIRDTKDRSQPALRYTAQEWTAFLAGVRAGEFDLT